MAERKQFRLERVLTDNALFSSAYGNVGSSIYYALGLVAALALGLTPLVFVIAGHPVRLTAATYTEATTMYPEAGGSSSFARHAFNETVSFGAAWVQVHELHRHGRDLGAVRPPLPRLLLELAQGAARGHHRRRRRHRLPRGDQHPRRPRGGAPEPDHGRHRPAHAARPLPRRRLPRPQLPHADRQHPLGHRPDVERPADRSPGRDDRLHRHRDRLEHVRGGDRRAEDGAERDAQGRARRRDHLRGAARRSRSRRCRSSSSRTAST